MTFRAWRGCCRSRGGTEAQGVANEGVISSKTSRISVRVIRTDEEWMIASMVCRVLDLAIEKEHE